MQNDDAEAGLQVVLNRSKKLGLSSDGVKPNEFIDLDEDVCVTAELTEDDIVTSLLYPNALPPQRVIRRKRMTGKALMTLRPIHPPRRPWWQPN